MKDKNGQPMTGVIKVFIVKASGAELAQLEAVHGVQQSAVVDNLIEDTCWSDHPRLTPYGGYAGTAADRLAAVLQAFADDGV